MGDDFPTCSILLQSKRCVCQHTAMNLVVRIPDLFADRLAGDADPERQVLEAWRRRRIAPAE